MDTSAFAAYLLKHFPLDDNSDDYWKLRIGEMMGPRSNIPLKNGMDLYVYDRLLPGITTWKEYYQFLLKMIEEYDTK